MANFHRPKFNADSQAQKANTPSILSVIVSLFISALTIFLAISCFPVLPRIYQPMLISQWLFYFFPTTLIGAIATQKLVLDVKNLRRNYSRLALGQTLILFSSLLLLILGISKAFYHIDPVNNFNAYVKQREEIVYLISSEQLKVDKSTPRFGSMQGDIFKLPEKLKGLSMGGHVTAIREKDALEVIFLHSTIGFFGDGLNYIIYRSDSDEHKISLVSKIGKKRKLSMTLKQLKYQWFNLVDTYYL